jgi:hypothetical protein
VEVSKEGIHNSDIPAPTQQDAPDGLVLGSAMHPQTIEYQMIGWTVKLDEVVDASRGYDSRQFQTDQPVVVGPRREYDRS